MRAPLIAVALATACGGTATVAQSPAPTPAAAAPAPARQFLLPALEIDKDLSLAVEEVDGKPPPRWKGKLVVDGHVTDAVWPEHPPAAYRIDDNRWLLHDRYNEYRLYVWERDRARLTDLGRGNLHPVAGKGHLVVLYPEKGEPIRFSEIDPKRPALRTVWQPDKARDRATVIGAHEGAIVIAQHAQQWGGNFAEDATLYFIEPDKTVERDVTLRGWRVASGDSIRDGRILLLEQQAPSGRFNPTAWTGSIYANLAIYDLADNEIRELDRATGDFSKYTAIPHPYIHVQWSTEAEIESRPLTFGSGWDCMTYVDEESEQVRALGCTTTILNATNVP